MTKPERTFTGLQARRLMRKRSKATLATLNREGGGPYGSLVNVSTLGDGSPVILISTLAWHTQNLLADPRGSILFEDTDGLVDPLTGPRVTVMGRFEKVADDTVRRRYLARHPSAELYVDFGDFAFWQMTVESAHAVAGFGRIETLEAEEILVGEGLELLKSERELAIISHMNEDHSDANALYATRLLGADDGDWTMTSIDPDGADLSNGERAVRLAFDTEIATGDDARDILVRLVKTARA
ncbi:MAG: DUF2470 domain-containing protein [Pseudomonadota bacterium]